MSASGRMARPRRRRDAGGEPTRVGGGGDTSPRFRKLTAWFREHLLSDDAQPTDRNTTPPYRRYSPTTRWRHAGSTAPISSSAFLAVARHHGRLPDTADYVHRASVEQSGRIQTLYRSDALEQAAHIDETVPELLRHSWTERRRCWRLGNVPRTARRFRCSHRAPVGRGSRL